MARVRFTATRIAEFDCPKDKTQAFLWDTEAPGLALRATAGGAKAFVFQSRLPGGESIRLTIGKPVDGNGQGAWTIPKAQAEAGGCRCWSTKAKTRES
jgi:hypothetical protein